MDTSIFSKESKEVVISINEQVPILDEAESVYNRIEEWHQKQLSSPVEYK